LALLSVLILSELPIVSFYYSGLYNPVFLAALEFYLIFE